MIDYELGKSADGLTFKGQSLPMKLFSTYPHFVASSSIAEEFVLNLIVEIFFNRFLFQSFVDTKDFLLVKISNLVYDVLGKPDRLLQGKITDDLLVELMDELHEMLK